MRLRTGTVMASMALIAIMVDRLPSGELFQFLALLGVGSVYVSRDYLQSLLGDYAVVMPMALVVIAVHFSSGTPYASASAFLVGQAMGWSVFTQLHEKPFHQRMLMSAVVACVVDTCIYLGIAGELDRLIYDFTIKMIPVLLVFLALVRTSQNDRNRVPR